jgi:hypothetical protein
MAKAARNESARSTSAQTGKDSEGTIRFSMANWILLGAGLLTVVLGYVLLSGGSRVAAPLLLVLGYLVLIPLGIIR